MKKIEKEKKLDSPACTACKSAARNFASSSGEYVDVGVLLNLGFGLFKSA